MNELFEQILSYLRAIWRYRWYAMVLVWLLAFGGWLAVAKMPDVYQASARVHVDTDSILRPLLRGLTVHPNVEQRLAMMARTLLSRPNLEEVARKTDLDLRAKGPAQTEAMLDRLADNIKLGNTRRENLYTISYANSDPKLAKDVVEAVLTIFMEKTLGDTRQDSDAAQDFLDERILEYEQKLFAAEERLKEFQREHVGLMPSSGQEYYAQLEAAQNQLEEARLKLKEAVNRRDELKQQLRGELPELGAEGAGNRQGTDMGTRTPLDERIQSLQTRLDDLLLQYTEQHPDVIALEATIQALKRQRQEEIEQVAGETGSAAEGASLRDNPLYQQLRISISEAEATVASLSVRVKEYQARVAQLKEMVNTVPEVEARLKRLNRDYAIHKKNYDELVARRETARISKDIEQAGDDVRFRVIDPPRVPVTPSGPNRPLLGSIVLAIALFAGLAVAFVMSQVRPAIYDRRTLRELTGFPVFGSISRLWTRQLLWRKRLELGGFVSVGMLLLIAYGGALWFYTEGDVGGLMRIAKGWL